MVAILALLVGLLLFSLSFAASEIIYPIVEMCGYHATSSIATWSSKSTEDSTAFEGLYKLDAACTTKIGNFKDFGSPSTYVYASCVESGGEYSMTRGIIAFKTINTDTSKGVRLYLRMSYVGAVADDDSLFVVSPTVRCRTGDCGSEIEACFGDSCNFYRCDETVWPETCIAYDLNPAPGWIYFDIPKEYVNYGDTTVFGLVTRLVPMDAPTGQNTYRTFSLENVFAYLYLYTGDEVIERYGLNNWGLGGTINYGLRRRGW